MSVGHSGRHACAWIEPFARFVDTPAAQSRQTEEIGDFREPRVLHQQELQRFGLKTNAGRFPEGEQGVSRSAAGMGAISSSIPRARASGDPQATDIHTDAVRGVPPSHVAQRLSPSRPVLREVLNPGQLSVTQLRAARRRRLVPVGRTSMMSRTRERDDCSGRRFLAI